MVFLVGSDGRLGSVFVSKGVIVCCVFFRIELMEVQGVFLLDGEVFYYICYVFCI